jgi:hypothetical protein
MALGLLLNALPLSRAALVLVALYGAWYGLAEATGRSGVSPPGIRWQVPQSLVAGVSRPRRILTWGSILGPGFATRNPYAGFALLPLAVAAVGGVRAGVVLAGLIGFAHGTGRALALLRDASAATATDHLLLVLRSMRWRAFDGYALLAISGAAAVACLYRL